MNQQVLILILWGMGMVLHDEFEKENKKAYDKEYNNLMEELKKKRVSDRETAKAQAEYDKDPAVKEQEEQQKKQGEADINQAMKFNEELLKASMAYQNFAAQLQEWTVDMAKALNAKYHPDEWLGDQLKSMAQGVGDWWNTPDLPGGTELISSMVNLTLQDTGPDDAASTTANITFNTAKLDEKLSTLVDAGELKEADKAGYKKMVLFAVENHMMQKGFRPTTGLPPDFNAENFDPNNPPKFDLNTYEPGNLEGWECVSGRGENLGNDVTQGQIDAVFENMTINTLCGKSNPTNTAASAPSLVPPARDPRSGPGSGP